MDSWSPGTGSTFALLPPDNATGNFTKVVQRVPVKIVLDPNPSLGTFVRPGMSVEPAIDTGAGPTHRTKTRTEQMRLHLAPVTSAGAALHAIADFHPRLTADALRPYVGMLGVLLGSVMGTLGSRVTTFGLADLRGGLSAGFDEGAWITTSYGIGQMLMGVAWPYLGALSVFGASFCSGCCCSSSPACSAVFSQSQCIPTMQFLGGVGSGTFIPLTIGFIVRSLPAHSSSTPSRCMR